MFKFNVLSVYFRENHLFFTPLGCVVWNRPVQLIYILRRFKWPMGFGQVTAHFILHEGPASVTRELLLAIGVWADELHNEIWVYNQGWLKNAGLWQEIQKARWEDVILESDFKAAIQKDVLGFFSSKDTYKSLGLPWKVISHLHGPLHHTYPIVPTKARTYFVRPTWYESHTTMRYPPDTM